jgi:hypothetical protein
VPGRYGMYSGMPVCSSERPSHYMKRFYYATQPVEEPENLRDLVTLMELYDGEARHRP